MKIVRFLGGLGNQMFQYAFYKSLENAFGKAAGDLSAFDRYELHNGFELEEIFPVSIKKAPPFLIKLYDPVHRNWHIRKLRRVLSLKNAYYEEKESFRFDETIYKDPGSRLYWGHWQNEAYFKGIASALKNDFLFKLPLEGKNLEVYKQIKDSNSVGVHVRRGDYLHDKLLGGICDGDYYKRAIDLILEKTGNAKFFVFSNDIPWCESALGLPQAVFISWNQGRQSYIDMQLMSSCRHNIIANSSFSWWAAWLNAHPGKVVLSPSRWTMDPGHAHMEIVPKEWLKI